ncbi:MAG: S1 RNA-binding domain-containing protein [Desulfobacterales bacterium]|nr:S1 RNA-binding domain-containing protein [Desulfobacterales bacterium]
MSEENFKDLVDHYMPDKQQTITVGDKIKGKILSISHDTAFIDTGTKIDGILETAGLLDKNGDFPYQVGDILDLYVISAKENEIKLSKALSKESGKGLLQDAYENNIPINGKVASICKGGFNIETMKARAFCPLSQIDIFISSNQEDYVGKEYQFLITKFEEKGKNIIVSRRKILEVERDEARKDFFAQIKDGVEFDGKVTKVMPFGVFVEIVPGVEGLVHVSELSWARIENPDEYITEGSPIKVKVLSFNKEQNKIALSAKHIEDDPWVTADQRFKVGDRVEGKVTRCANFGAFVELTPGIEGMIHISEMSYTKRIQKTEDVVNPGDKVYVVIKDMDLANRKISLSLKDAEGDPWQNVGEKYKEGKIIEGIVEKKEKSGFIILLDEGISAFLPFENINKTSVTSGTIKKGDRTKFKLEKLNPKDRKIILSLSDFEEDEWKDYVTTPKQTIGTLGRNLQDALKPNFKKQW